MFIHLGTCDSAAHHAGTSNHVGLPSIGQRQHTCDFAAHHARALTHVLLCGPPDREASLRVTLLPTMQGHSPMCYSAVHQTEKPANV